MLSCLLVRCCEWDSDSDSDYVSDNNNGDEDNDNDNDYGIDSIKDGGSDRDRVVLPAPLAPISSVHDPRGKLKETLLI